MADNTCVRCREGEYTEVDREQDFQKRVFLLLECNRCKSLVIRREGWDPADWQKSTLE